MAVNVVQSALSSRRFNKLLPWFAGGLLAIGVISLPGRPLREHGRHQGDLRQPAGEPAAGHEADPARARGACRSRKVHPHRGRAQEPRRGLDSQHAQHQGRADAQAVDDGQHPRRPSGRADRQGRDHEDHLLDEERGADQRGRAAQPNKVGVQATLYVVIVKKVGPRWLIDYAVPQASPGAPAPS